MPCSFFLRSVVPALFVALSIAASACGSGAPERKAPGPVPVVVAAVVRKDMPVEVRAIGAAEAVNTVQVIPQVGGLIQAVHFKEGDTVKKGDLLFTIDTRPYAATLSAAQAELEKNRALADQAHREVDRFQKLAAEGLTSDLELSQRRAAAAALDATVGQNQANLVGSSINVQFAAIRSPIDGRTGTLLVHAGNVVRGNDGRSLVVIRSLEPIYVRFAVPEQYLPSVQARMKAGPIAVEAQPRGSGLEPAVGDLTFIENAVDSATGKIDMKALFRNEGDVLWPGQLVDVTVRLSTEKNVIVVPEAAVQMGQEGAYVYVVNASNKATLRLVQVDRTIGNEMVVKSGLSGDEKVIVDGQVRVRDGATVQAKAAPPGSTASVTSARSTEGASSAAHL